MRLESSQGAITQTLLYVTGDVTEGHSNGERG